MPADPRSSAESPHHSAAANRNARRKATGCVVALVLFALIARLAGIGYSLPHEAHPDERVWTSQVARARGATDPLTVNFARFYPDLVPRICALATSRVEPPANGTSDEHRHAASLEVLRLRTLGMLLSLLAIPAVYRIARTALSRRASVFAAALAASSVMVQWYSQQARPHAAAGAFVAIALLLMIRARHKPTLPRWIAAGLACAAALSTLQSAAALVPAFVVAAFLAEAEPKRGLWRWIGPAVGVLMMLVALSFQPALGPASTAPADTGGDGAGSELDFFGHRVSFSYLDGSGFAVLAQRAFEIDPLIFALVAVGIVLLIVQRPRELTLGPRARDMRVLLAHAIPYALVIGLYANSFDRFLIPLVPVATMVAAGGVLGWEPVARRSTTMIAAVILVLQFAYAARLSWWRASDDTVEQAARWIEENVKPTDGTIVTLPYIDVPVLRTSSALKADSWQRWQGPNVWQRYLETVPPADLDARGYDLSAVPLPKEELDRKAVLAVPGPFIAQITARYVITARVPDDPLATVLRAELAGRATLVARMSPWRDDSNEPLVPWTGRRTAPTRMWLTTLLRARSPGQIVEIWHVEQR